MGKHAKESTAPNYVSGMVANDKTQTISDIQKTVENVRVIDESIKKHPIPEPTVKP